jgi:hypothetical protein
VSDAEQIEGVEKMWGNIKEGMQTAAIKCLGYKKRNSEKKDWHKRPHHR